jgi:long-chain acyl-CoA synthetase
MRDGWFLTGDLGRLDAAGRLTITGRKKEVIILANGKNIYPEEIEAHYRRSPFVKEICVTTLGGDGTAAGERLYGVAVPDLDVLREKKIVNAGEILRFELEGLSASLPSYKRVLGYEVWFEPLPRTTTGKLKRHEIVRRLRQSGPAAPASAGPAADEAGWPADPQVDRALGVVRRRVAAGVTCRPASNLELDLGLDSMERVELLTDLEQEFGVRVPEEQTHQIFTLGALIDAIQPGTATVPDSHSPDGAPKGNTASLPPLAASRPVADESWAVLLRDLPPVTDPVLSGLLEPRPLLEPWLLLFVRLVSRVMSRVAVTGLDKLPRGGAFLICPNHQSYLDPFFVCGVLPARTLARTFFVGAVEYFETPLMKWVARKVHCVPVDPDSNLVPAMKAGAFGLAHGKVLILFPEGERSIDGTVKRFKKGGPILSRYMGVPVIPVAIKGAYEVWPRGGSFNWRGLLPWSRSHVKVQFGDPMQFTDGESYAEGATRLREVVEGMWRVL